MTDAIKMPPHPPHIPAAVVSWAVMALGALGLMDRWGLTADDVAAVLGAVMGLASTVYAVMDRRNGVQP